MQLIWLDLETTGLDPRFHDILEVAAQFATLDDPARLEPKVVDAVLGFSALRRAGLSDFILEMHRKSGLLDACHASDFTLSDAEDLLLALVPEVADKEQRPVLAGSSVHFDLGFLRVHMPQLAARLSHRVFDTTAIALFCRSLGMPKREKRETHRAMVDVLESVGHYEQCVEWLRSCMCEGYNCGFPLKTLG